MNRAVLILKNKRDIICENIESTREQIDCMRKRLSENKIKLFDLIEEEKAIRNAIDVLSDMKE